MEVIIFIIIIAIVVSNSKKNNSSKHQAVPNQPRNQSVTAPNQSRYQTTPNTPRTGKTSAQLKEEIWERLSEESRAKFQNRDIQKTVAAASQRVSNAYEAGKRTGQPGAGTEQTAAQQVAKRREESRTTSILERAKGNVSEYENDVTLEMLEVQHHHSERVAPAVHNHPEDMIPESMLGTVSDLMVKGYEGNLCFERDFVGEAMDMINRFTVPNDIPDYSMPK